MPLPVALPKGGLGFKRFGAGVDEQPHLLRGGAPGRDEAPAHGAPLVVRRVGATLCCSSFGMHCAHDVDHLRWSDVEAGTHLREALQVKEREEFFGGCRESISTAHGGDS